METETTQGGVDRRSALKKAALAAGVVAWTTPVVQAVAPGVASAADGLCTGCDLDVSYSLIPTGSNCGCVARYGVEAKSKCCSKHTLYLNITKVSCGASCGGVVTDYDAYFTGQKRGQCDLFFDLGNCSPGAGATVSFVVEASCCNGTVPLTKTVTVDTTCQECATDNAIVASEQAPAEPVEQAPAEPVEQAPAEQAPPVDAGGSSGGAGTGDGAPADPPPAAPEGDPAPEPSSDTLSP